MNQKSASHFNQFALIIWYGSKEGRFKYLLQRKYFRINLTVQAKRSN